METHDRNARDNSASPNSSPPRASSAVPPGSSSTSSSSAPRFSLSLNATSFVPNVNARPFYPPCTVPVPVSVPAPAPAPAPVTVQPPAQVPSSLPSRAPSSSSSSSSSSSNATPSNVEKPKQTNALDTLSEQLNQALIDSFFTNQKERLSIVFIGHVDAGKSTMGGNILYLTGMVDQRTMEKFMRDAREAGRESWYLSWALDTNDEERSRGKTVETGRAFFETESRKYTILDAPGHKNYVPSMIQGASQADVAILVISARRGEFETGFEGGGQTREHAMLVKTAGIKRLIVVINKMDDPTVNWSEERYNECRDKLIPFLKKDCKYNIKNDVVFVPVSGFSGANLLKRLTPDVCSFYSGPSLLEILDSIPIDHSNAAANAPFIMPISDKFSDMGVFANGKIESGIARKGLSIIIMPAKIKSEILLIVVDANEVEAAQAGDNVAVKLKGIKEDEITSGSVLCLPSLPLPSPMVFDAQLYIIATERIITAGYQAIMHVHNAVEEVTIAQLLHNVCKKTGKRSVKPPRFANTGSMVIARIETTHPLCIDLFKNNPGLGRFTLRLNTLTVAMGKVLKVFLD